VRPFVRTLVRDMYLRNINVHLIVQHLVTTGLNKAATPAAVIALCNNF